MSETIFDAPANCIRTYTGKHVNVFAPSPEMFCIEDIAHALAQMPRFGGHLKYFYSVAQHSMACARDIETQNLTERYTALMHDATEAYLHDMPTPIKKGLSDYQALTWSLEKYLAGIFGFIYPLPIIVVNTDYGKLLLEWNALMINRKDWSDSQSLVEIDFLRCYETLKHYRLK